MKIEYVEASAEVTGLPTGAFDVVGAGQCWHWFGRPAAAIRAGAPVAGTLDDDGVRACSRELTAMLAQRFPEDPLSVPHRTWAVTARAVKR